MISKAVLGSPEHVETLSRLKKIEVKTYRGLHIDASMPEAIVDEFLDSQSDTNERWERFLNHEHIHDSFLDIEDNDMLWEITRDIEEAWKQKLSTIDTRYEVYTYFDDANGPSITFCIRE